MVYRGISITICGDGRSGKSSILQRLLGNSHIRRYDPTIEDHYVMMRDVKGVSYQVTLTDTGGQAEYRALQGTSSMQSNAFLVVYDITDPEALDTLEYFTNLIKIESDRRLSTLDELPPVVVIAGNKCDLEDERQIRRRDGRDWAFNHRCGFIETSARKKINTEEALALLMRTVIKSRQMKARRGKPSASQPKAPKVPPPPPPLPKKSLSPQTTKDAHSRPTQSTPKPRPEPIPELIPEPITEPSHVDQNTKAYDRSAMPTTPTMPSKSLNKSEASPQNQVLDRQPYGLPARSFTRSSKIVPSVEKKSKPREEDDHQSQSQGQGNCCPHTFGCSGKNISIASMKEKGNSHPDHEQRKNWCADKLSRTRKMVPPTLTKSGSIALHAVHAHQKKVSMRVYMSGHRNKKMPALLTRNKPRSKARHTKQGTSSQSSQNKEVPKRMKSSRKKDD